VERELDGVADALGKAREEVVGDALSGGDIDDEEEGEIVSVAVDVYCDCDCDVLANVVCAINDSEESSPALKDDNEDETAVADSTEDSARLEALTLIVSVPVSPSLCCDNTVDT
jgi:hypothetical protein